MDITTLSSFLGWATLAHFALLCICALCLFIFRDLAVRLHARWFGINPEALPVIYFKFLANYEVLVIAFFFVPWFVLWAMF